MTGARVPEYARRIWVLALALAAGACIGGRQATARILSEHTVRAGDLVQYCRTYGDGPPLLLLHGLTNTWRLWHPYLDAFGATHTLIVPDLRGHGDTPSSSPTFGAAEVARDMFGLLDAVGVDEIEIIGYSFGGHVALRMAAQQPQRVTAMIVVAGAHRLLGDSRERHAHP